ncbi:gliding motility protein GldB-related protein [Neolewinella antarctica]|uniref:Uncharacterized protein n=1 Tax=Neolewinella antarctica TaxID=442734 RepID=A0ABX0XF30_9BACT|nr:hypothetical protein [Neolewinella antarctica]NJC27915.1 hypothetical protein [Neolewinella antarctica]
MMNNLTVFSLLITLVCLTACVPDEPPPPDVSAINAPLALVRFDRAMFNIDTTDVANELDRLERDYGEFAKLYLRHVAPIRRGDFGPEEQLEIAKAFLRHEPLRRLDSIVQKRFDDDAMEAQRRELQQALKYYHYYLPDAPLPDTLTAFLYEFGYAALIYGDTDLGVGLDFFLGPEFDYSQVNTQEAVFSQYLARTYRPEYMTRKLLQILIEDHLPRPRSGRLLDYIVYEGKKLFLLDRILPEVADEIIYEVTADQMDWLRDNEIPIYAHLQTEDQLYSTSTDLIRKLTQPAPTTQGMPAASPGRAVNYLGKRIVDAYVTANPNVTMTELMRLEDGQVILAGARFKPRG